MKFLEITAEEFEKFEHGKVGGGFYQKVRRAELRRKMGWRTVFVGVKEGEEVLAVGLIIEKRKAALLQMGPILDYQNRKLVRFFLEEIKKFAKEQKWATIEIFPPVLLSVREVHGEKVAEYDQKKLFSEMEKAGFRYEGATIKVDPRVIRWMSVKDLSEFRNMDEIRASYKKNVRNKLRKVSKDIEIHVLEDKSELKDWILPLKESDRKNGVESWGRGLDYYEDLWEIFGDQVEFMVARKKDDKETVAARVVFYFPEETETFSSGTIQKYKKLNGMTVMQDWQIERCFSRGIKRINFYGVEGDFSENNRLLEFKSGFGIKVEEYIGGFKYVVSPIRLGFYLFQNKVQAAKKLVKKVFRAGKR